MTAINAILRAGRRLDARGLIAGRSGNISSRIGDAVLATPTGQFKGELTEDDLVLICRVDGAWRPGPRASSEIAMHLAIYDACDRAAAVVHAHPAVATALATASRRLDLTVTAEGAVCVGPIARIGWVRPGGRALADAVARAARHAHVIVMAGHGAVTWDTDVDAALARMESLEHVARIARDVDAMGGPRLEPSEVTALRAAYGLDASAPCEAIECEPIAGCVTTSALSES